MKFNKWLKENKKILIPIGFIFLIIFLIIFVYKFIETSSNIIPLTPINYSAYNYSLLSIYCYGNYIEIGWFISSNEDILGEGNIYVSSSDLNYSEVSSFDIGSASKKGKILSNNFSLILGQTYNVSVVIAENIKTIICTVEGVIK